MQKRALVIASMASMIDNFNRNNIIELEKLGYKVDIAANFETEDSNSYEKVQMFRKEMIETGHKVIHIDFSRRLESIRKQILSIKQVRMLSKNDYDLVHCHSPICSVIVRLVFHNKKAKLIYTAHGFHFYKGAPLKNWLIYYPIEKWLSRYTDVLITINKEDYARAKKKFHAQRTEYVPGVGIDVEKFKNTAVDRNAKRKELGIPEDAFLMISVGELNKNKNHQVVIRALAQLNDSHIHYMIAGKGELLDYLTNLAKQLGVSDQVHFLGYRNDVAELYKISDIDVFPSIREGLGLAAIEGMAAGLPLICSDNRGTREYAVPNENACVCSTPMDYLIAIQKMYTSNVFADSLGKKGAIKADSFSVDSINRQMKRLYFDFK